MLIIAENQRKREFQTEAFSADLLSLPKSLSLGGGFWADGIRARGQRLFSVLSSGFKARSQVRWGPCPRLLSVTTLGSEARHRGPVCPQGQCGAHPPCCVTGLLSFSLFKILPPSAFNLWLLFICSFVSESLQPRGLQHARLPCPSPSPRGCSNSCPLSQ